MNFSGKENMGLFFFFFDGNMVFTDYWKVLVLNFSEIKNTVFFWARRLMERWYLLITEKVLFWTFQRWEIWSFSEPESWWKYDSCWLLKSSCFELFDDGKYSLIFSQEIDGKMIFTCSFWAFHDIPGLGKYGFLCSVMAQFLKFMLWLCTWLCNYVIM